MSNAVLNPPVAQRAPSWLRHHSLGCVTVVAIIAITVAAYFWMTRPLSHSATLSVVVTTHNLPAYAVITATDLVSTPTSVSSTDVITQRAAVLGKTTIVPLDRGSALTAPMVVAVPRTWILFSVPISSTLAITPGDTITLLGIWGDARVADKVSNQAIVLHSQDSQVVIALPETDALRAAPYLLPDHQLIVVRTLSQKRQ